MSLGNLVKIFTDAPGGLDLRVAFLREGKVDDVLAKRLEIVRNRIDAVKQRKRAADAGGYETGNESEHVGETSEVGLG